MVSPWVYSLPNSSRTWQQIYLCCHLTIQRRLYISLFSLWNRKAGIAGKCVLWGTESFSSTALQFGKLPSTQIPLSLFPDPRTNCSQKLCSLLGGNCSSVLARILPSPFREQVLFMCSDPGSSFTCRWDTTPSSFQKALNCPRVSILFSPLSRLCLIFG